MASFIVTKTKDKQLEKEILESLAARDGHCPCALIINDDSRCMCKDFRDKIENGYVGECNCGLYEVSRE